jgi:hypothetical protein
MADAAASAKGHTTGIARLRAWAINPAEGGKLFQWGKPGDFDRCVKFYRGKVPGHMLKGWCANLHKIATGATPGNAPGERRD